MRRDRWTPDGTNSSLFDRVIPEARWTGYAIHRLEFWDSKEPTKWSPTVLDPAPRDVLDLLHGDAGT